MKSVVLLEQQIQNQTDMFFQRAYPLLIATLLLLIAAPCHASKWVLEGQAFLEANKARAGVVTLPSGLQYRVIIPGKGAIPKRHSNVAVYYRGTLFDGTEFDSASITRPPVVLNVSRLIRGWQEALMLMPEGSLWEITVPSELGYGRRGSGKAIPPDSVLVFELELVEIR
jgi:FKBP-type peptidyl-prolyl cis-trans isomerase FklB